MRTPQHMAELIALFDWAKTPLGALESWPQSLRTAVDIMLGSDHPMQLAWGDECTVLYNDACAALFADRHPWVLGRSLNKACADGWDDIAPLVNRVLAGETIRSGEMPPLTSPGHQGQSRWTFSCSPVRDESGAVRGLLSVAVDQRPQLLLSEMRHRMGNNFAVIKMIARRSARSASSVAEYKDRFDGRLDAFARVQSLIARAPEAGIDLHTVVAGERDSLGPTLENAVHIHGPAISLTSRATERLAMAIHELAANARQHGALKNLNGRVEVSWALAADHLDFGWRESGCANLQPPARQGFGTEVIDRIMAYDLGATTSMAFEPQGLVCRIAIPLAHVTR